MKDASKPDLEARIKAYYDSHHAPGAIHGRITQAIQEGELGNKVHGSGSAWRSGATWKWGLAGSLAAVMALLIFAGPPLWRATRYADLRAIAGEIALNHHKQLAPEFQIDRFADLAAAMPKLDFALIEPDRIRTHGQVLVGGRYCSIGGSLAVQMRLRDQAGRDMTLYEFVVPAHANLSEQSLKVDDVVVDIWFERGIVCGLARSQR
jgi:hypothetical protein